MLRFVFCLLLCGLVAGQRRDIAYKDCGSKAKILSAQLEPCDSDPCVMKRGTKPKVYFTVTSDQDTQTAKLDATIDLFGVAIPIPGLETDLCKSAVKCPISKGETYTGSMEVVVPSFAPAMKTTVSLKVIGDQGVSVCAETPVLVE